ncbi:hypothetical protein PLESTB_001806400 [Pleodorina starrii]|uniref:PI31 proteasome regulator N-terminal domain-containing protein n=1 Tax=Pleodorina starrii TaxID=330485 RepID=A0A9W6C0V4_9CHLO|nr:hypothetical protein PLESTM_001045700 [Pleodorina starrii]GLC61817.1 hypothetical protein PLESTB_001806400 [Pleodorina starrii]
MDDVKLAQLLEKACPRPSYLASSDGGPALALALHCLMVEAGFVLAPEGGQGGSSDPEARFVPQKDWNGMFLDQWVFTYTKPGKARKFTMHCSLQARTKRMFVHSCEENNYANVCVLGLQLDNYVPHPAALRSNNWAAGAPPPPPPPAAESAAAAPPPPAGQPEPSESAASPPQRLPVVRNAAKMCELMTEYILNPLLQAAEDEQGPPPPEAAAVEAVEAAAETPQRQPGGGGGWWVWSAAADPAAAQGVRGYYATAVGVGLLAVGVAALLVLGRSRQTPGLGLWRRPDF